MRFFSYESRFSQLLMKLSCSCLLNILWFICSLPVFTIGASTTALYYACLKVIRDEESHAWKLFFHSFKENFKQATQLWLILLGAGLFLGADGYILYHLRKSSTGAMAVIWTLILALVIAASIIYVIVLLYVFPLLASVHNTNTAMLKNAFLIGTHYLFATILVFAVHFAMFFAVVAVFTPLIIFGEGLCAMVSAWILNSLLIAVSGTPEDYIDDEPEKDPDGPEESPEELPENAPYNITEEKAEHIFTYHKWTILLVLVALIVLGSIIHRQLTQKKPVLYLAVINVSFGEDVQKSLTEDFVTGAGFDERRQEVYLYRDLYLSEDADTLNHEYAYASKVKLSGAISAGKLDLVLMNREAYDIFSRQGYLLELTSLPNELSPFLTMNEVILSDNSVDYLLGNAEEEQVVTETVPNSLTVSSLPLFRDAGFDGDLYLGVVSNSSRQEEAAAYLRYLFGLQ